MPASAAQSEASPITLSFKGVFSVQGLQERLGKTPNGHDRAGAVSYRMAIAASLSSQLSLLVKTSSIRQATWGLASAGPHKALRYAMSKVEKGRGSI